MNLREFWRFHFLKVLLILVVIQIIVIAIIQNYNHRPVAVEDSASILENRELKLNPITNDTDKDDHTDLTIASFEQPLHGKVEQHNNFLIYVPENNYFGPDSFKYAVSDGDKISDNSFIKIQVLENLPPVALPDTIAVYCQRTICFDVMANDNDGEGDSIFVTEFTQPENGTLTKEGNNFYYSSTSASPLTDGFSYILSDGRRSTKEIPVVIDVLSKENSLYPWLTSDIGNAEIKGSATKDGGKYILKGSGRDIWQEQDGFRYLYQYVEGDCELTAKIESLEASHDWAKTGIMIRENLSGGSKHSFMVLSNRNGATTHQRTGQDNGTSGTSKISEITVPYWVRLKRHGNQFTYSISKDNVTWKTIEQIENDMDKKVYIGVVCTSHNNSELATVVYSNLKLTARDVKM